MRIQTDIDALVLRPWREEDKPSLVRHGNNREIWRNLTNMFPHPYTAADADDWVGIANGSGDAIHLAIVHEGEAIGGVGIIPDDDIHRHNGQFGYWIGEAHWGKGFATAAARAIVRHAFAGPRFQRLEAEVFAWNPASMRVLEKLGFTREGVHRKSVFKDDQFVDCVMYALLREDVASGS